jgi:hypothetical protein
MSDVVYHRPGRGEIFEEVIRNCPEPEKKLMLAVLHDALASLDGERTKRAAWKWIMARENDSPFCFESICEALDWNADRVRNRLLSLQTRQRIGRKRKL